MYLNMNILLLLDTSVYQKLDDKNSEVTPTITFSVKYTQFFASNW